MGHRVYVEPCGHYAVIKGCSRDPLTGDPLYLVLCNGEHPNWAHEDCVIDCGDAVQVPRALLAQGGWA